MIPESYKHIELGHRLQTLYKGTGSSDFSSRVSDWNRELKEIGEALAGSKGLNFVTVPFSFLCDASAVNGHDTPKVSPGISSDSVRDCPLSLSMRDVLGNRAIQIMRMLKDQLRVSDETRIGVELTTELLSCFEGGNALPRSKGLRELLDISELSTIVEDLYIQEKVVTFTVAMNAFTYKSASEVMRVLRGVSGPCLLWLQCFMLFFRSTA